MTAQCPPAASTAPDLASVRLEAEARDYLSTVEAQFDSVPVESTLRFGEPVPEILLESEAFGADLIALTSRTPHRLTRLVLGSTADQVCRSTDAAVLVYRECRTATC